MRKILASLLIVLLSTFPLLAQQARGNGTLEPHEHTFQASNGFVVKVVVHDNHHDVISTDQYGESVTMHIRMDLTAGVIETQIGDATLRSQHLDDGTVDYLEFIRPDNQMFRHDLMAEKRARAEQRANGIISDAPEHLRTTGVVHKELGAYGRVLGTTGFWQDFSDAGREFKATWHLTPAGCFWSCTGCTLSLVAYGIGMGLLLASCGATFGATCWVAFGALFIDKAAIVIACTDCITCLLGTPSKNDEDDDDGIEGPIAG